MRVTILSAIYPPEPVVSGQVSAQLASALAGAGHDVTAISAFPNRPAGRLYEGWRRVLYRRDRTVKDYALFRCFATLSPVSSLASRLMENLSFGITGGVALLARKKPDVLFLNTWPLLATGIAALTARLRRVPYVLSIQDLYPDSLVSQGRIRAGGLAARMMLAVDSWIARGAGAVVVISKQFGRRLVEGRRVPPERVHLIPNWVRSDLVDLGVGGGAMRDTLGIPRDGWVFGYGGNVGVAAGVEDLIGAFEQSGAGSSSYLVVAGAGSCLEACRELAGRSQSGRVVIHSPWPADETSAVLGAFDVAVLPTRGQQTLASVPSKLLGYMLAARPVLAQAVAESETASIIAESGCGWVVPPDEPELLADVLHRIRGLPAAEMASRGRAGRQHVLANLSHEVLLPALVNLVVATGQR